MDVSNPKVLRKLKIDEFSLVDAPASVGSDVLIWKRADSQPLVPKSTAEGEAEIRKLEARLATTNANYAALEAMELINKRDPASAAKAGDIFKNNPDAYEAYRAQMVGQRWQAAVSEPEDTRSSIERSLAEGQAKLREIAKAEMDEQKLAEAKAKLRNIFSKLKTKRDKQVAQARVELAELLATSEGQAAMYDLAAIGQLAAAA
jgi:hypothetical protein